MRRGVLFVVVALALVRAAAASAAAPEAFVRVDQLGYRSGAPARAYLMSTRPLSGAHFTLRQSGGTVAYSGAAGPLLGAWSPRFPYVYALDFTAPSAAARYELQVAGEPGASSPSFPIAAPEAIYGPALANSLSFYENEMDGPDYVPSALRTAPAHLNDEHAMTYLTPRVNDEGEFKGELQSLHLRMDAAGGWWDAGDYLKFVQTTSYVVALQLIGVRDFPWQMGAGAAKSNFAEEARFGLEWLLRMWNDKTRTLYYQVGIGAGNSRTISDHDIWRLPQQDDTYGGNNPLYRFIRNRPVFRAGPPDSPVSPNLAGRLAADFALCYQVFDQTRPALADRCLLAAEHVYGLADTDPTGHLLTTIPWDFYPESEWRDDLTLGASELALALQGTANLPAGLPHSSPFYYLHSASHWAAEYTRVSGAGEALNLYDVSGIGEFELALALRAAGDPPALPESEASLIAALGEKLGAAEHQAARDPFGFGFPWAAADTTSHGGGLSVMASEYDFLTASDAYQQQSERWLGNVLGANAWGTSLIVGDGSTFPECIQHQVANIVGSLDGKPPVLAGAAVEGPSNEPSSGFLEGMRPCPVGGGNPFARFDSGEARYEDNMEAYTYTEPAIDLTASSMLAFSWQTAAPDPPELLASPPAPGPG